MRSESPRTITIFLATGSPNGIKKLEISNRTIRAYVIPRIKIADAKKFNELTQPGFYLLFNPEGTQAYIGESENVYERLIQHIKGKDFWEVAVAFIATNNSLDKADIKYLESLAVEASKAAGQIETQNATIPPRNNLHEFKAPTIEEFFDDAKLLTSTLGFSLFDEVTTLGITEADMWHCTGRNTVAKGIASETGFKVLSGSLIDATEVPSFASNFPRESTERSKKLNENAERVSEQQYRLTNDLTFQSVSRASGFCLGRPSNGWQDWKNKVGKTMDEVLRKAAK